MAASPRHAIAPIVTDINSTAEQQFRFYLRRRLSQLSLIASLAIAPYFLFVGIAHTRIPSPDVPGLSQTEPLKAIANNSPAQTEPYYPMPTNLQPNSNAINTALAALFGGGGLVALWRAKSDTDAKAHEFSIKLLTMQKELLESNRTEVVKHFESRTEGITNELKLIRDRLVMLEHEVSQLQK
jgi:hypothetical protein